MNEPSPYLVKIAAAVCDSLEVDWTEAAATAETPEDKQVLEKLREIEDFLQSQTLSRPGADLDRKPAESEPLTRWAHLEVLEKLGEGTSGAVYRARDTHLRHEVALKLFHATGLNDYQKARLLEEGRRHVRVKHENVVAIHGAAEHDGRMGIWMEYVPGATLENLCRLDEHGTFSAAEATTIGVELCRALAAVHRARLTHGDIKAQNVVRERGGRVVLMDFSAAEPLGMPAEKAGPLMGTPLYSAPERLLMGAGPSPQADLYSLGVLLFYLVTGTFPVVADTRERLAEAHRRGDRRSLRSLRPDLPQNYVDAVEAALAPNPHDRVDSADSLEKMLLSTRPVSDLVGMIENAARTITLLARVGIWLVLGVTAIATTLAIVGFTTMTNFRLAVRMPPEFFSATLLDYIIYGWRSLFLGYYLLVGDLTRFVPPLAVPVLLVILLRPLRERAKTALARLRTFIVSVNSAGLAAVFLLLSLFALLSAIAAFEELLIVMSTMEELTEPTANLSILSPACEQYHGSYSHMLARIALVLVGGWLALLFLVNRRKEHRALALSLHGASAVVIVTVLVFLGLPWPLLWNNEFEPIRLNGEKGYVIAEQENELFVYLPTSQERRQAIVTEADPGVERYAEGTREILFGDFEPQTCP